MIGGTGRRSATSAPPEHQSREAGLEDTTTPVKHLMAKWIAAEKAKAGLRHVVVCPNVTGRTKKRIAQSKRARADSLALDD